MAETQLDCSLLESVVPAWLYHFSLSFDQEVACQPVFCRKTDLHSHLWSPRFPALERLTEMSLISRIQTSVSSVLNLDFRFQAAKVSCSMFL